MNSLIDVFSFFRIPIVNADVRSRRKRRQFSSASYYLAGVNPYANANVPVESLTYPSGSFYNAPNNVHSEQSFNQQTNYQQNGFDQYAQGSQQNDCLFKID